MITKINSFMGIKPISYNYSKENENKDKKESFEEKKYATPTSEQMKSYYLSFKGDISNKKLQELESAFTPKANLVYENAQKLAQKYRHNEVQEIHVLRVVTDMILDTIEEMDKGNLDSIEDTAFASPDVISDRFGKDVFKEPEQRKILKEVLKEENKFLDSKLKQMPKSKPSKTLPKLSKDYLNAIYSRAKDDAVDESEVSDELRSITDWYLFDEALTPSDDKATNEIANPYISKLSKALMVYRPQKTIPLDFYEDMSKKVWRNLAIGKDVFIVYDKNANKDYSLDTLERSLRDSKDGFGKFNSKNTEINRFNENINADFLIEEIKRGIKQKEKQHVYIFDYADVRTHNSKKSICNFEQYVKELHKYPNIKFVVTSEKEDYYSNIIEKDSEGIYNDFAQITMPLINKDAAKKMFRKEKFLLNKIKKDFSSKAIDKAVEAADNLGGFYPEKAQKVLRLIASYYADKKDAIVEKDVKKYINEAKDIFKGTDDKNDSSVQIVSDTGVKLKDIIGLKTTKKEAESIVRQIKDKSIGTKGFIIYSLDDMPGSGRNYTAKAIAGEAKIPFLEINAVDFGTEDVNIFGDKSTSPEMAMKKLFSMAKAQAETNPRKAFMLYIQNFEFFSCGDQVSEYNEKAMSQLLREMDSAQKQGLNIVVMGSVGDKNLIGESTMKSFKFVDKIEIESPKNSTVARKELIDYYIDKKKIKLDAKTPEEKNAMIDKFATMTEYHSLISIMTLLDKVKNVSKERGRKTVDVGDFIEAYMQIECGRPSNLDRQPFTKEITTSHECGHAINATVMNELTKSIKPWTESNLVSFITLDPRGHYLGAVYPNNPNNTELTFERMFADIVLSFGGYSCEKHFYGIDGSYGITSDMEQATSYATEAVGIMGQGHYFGKKSLNGVAFADDDDKERINKDIRVFLRNAETVSNLIVEEYEDFIKQFTAKYSSKVGTGECIIPGETFRKDLADWRKTLSPEKKKDLEAVNEIIKEIITTSRKGIIYEGDTAK